MGYLLDVNDDGKEVQVSIKPIEAPIGNNRYICNMSYPPIFGIEKDEKGKWVIVGESVVSKELVTTIGETLEIYFLSGMGERFVNECENLISAVEKTKPLKLDNGLSGIESLNKLHHKINWIADSVKELNGGFKKSILSIAENSKEIDALKKIGKVRIEGFIDKHMNHLPYLK